MHDDNLGYLVPFGRVETTIDLQNLISVSLVAQAQFDLYLQNSEITTMR